MLPNKLATTYGIELTYVPAYMDELVENAKSLGVTATTHFANNAPLATTLKKVLDKHEVEFYNCTNDPECVEVPTKPYNSVHKLRRNVRQITYFAKQLGLTPKARYTIGGGAHIHCAIPYSSNWRETDVRYTYFAQVMQVWATKNPWMTYAFAGCNDDGNANPLVLDDITQANTHYYRQRLKQEQERLAGNRLALVHYERILHEAGATPSRKRTAARGIAESQEYIQQSIKEVARYKAIINSDTSFVPSKQVSFHEVKNRNIVKRNGTMEWRCFVMPRHATGHEKHLAIVDKIVRFAMSGADTMMETGIDTLDMRGAYTKEALEKMTLRQAQVGLNKMLDSLGLDREDYKDYYRNMTLRFWLARKNRSLITG